ncbi:MAG: glycosyltransferase family 39 protein [Candidatus Yanofskybacteria bacterium]|nr:glycosyltransferase family 39 protein [Candidatus Yanofskybacteria bacterium]
MRRNTIIFISIVLIFIALRLPGLDLPYHQDEQKYVARGVLLQGVGVTSGHPPLLGIIMTAAGFLFGDAFFRLMPLLFGVGSLVMLYILMRVLFDSRAAFLAGLLYAISPYGVLASLMVDVDGAVLPFFAFSAFLFYILWHQHPEKRRLYGMLCLLSLIFGALVKLSFVLVFAAIGVDLAIKYWRKGHHRAVYITGAGLILLPLLILGFISLLASALPSFDFGTTIGHAQDYFRFSGRNYAQIAYQLFKALLYLSPLLVVPAFFVSRQMLIKLQLLVLYLGLALIFYLVLFDFSSAALDKYLMVTVIPLSALSGVALSKMERTHQFRGWLGAGLIVAVFLALIQLLPHAVPPLYPKGEWLGRILKLRWNFLVPFMGGSGPLGFYSSWFFLGASWIVALSVGAFAFIRRTTTPIRYFVFVIGIAYSVIMLSDMLFGYPYGSSKKVFNDILQYVQQTPSVQSVITFNDVGAYYLNKMGKYERRMFTAPKYEKLYKDILDKHYGHLLIIDIPRIYEDSVYGRYISSCQPEFMSRSGYISATLYDCAEHAEL